MKCKVFRPKYRPTCQHLGQNIDLLVSYLDVLIKRCMFYRYNHKHKLMKVQRILIL